MTRLGVMVRLSVGITIRSGRRCNVIVRFEQDGQGGSPWQFFLLDWRWPRKEEFHSKEQPNYENSQCSHDVFFVVGNGRREYSGQLTRQEFAWKDLVLIVGYNPGGFGRTNRLSSLAWWIHDWDFWVSHLILGLDIERLVNEGIYHISYCKMGREKVVGHCLVGRYATKEYYKSNE